MGISCSSTRNSLFLDNYVVGKTLGQGLHAKVKLVIDRKNKKKFAAKLFFAKNEETSSFLNEVNSLNVLKHKNIIEMEKFGKIEYNGKEVQYILLEHAENHDLFDFVSLTGGFEESMAKLIFSDILEAVEYIHTKGYAHRDLKLENIVLDKNWNIKLIDLGFCEPLNALEPKIVGTKNYMAPELLNSSYKLRPSALDIFALGVILFIIRTGVSPFHYATNDDDNYRLWISNERKKFWREIEEGLDYKLEEEFKTLIGDIFEPDPKKRISLKKIKESTWLKGLKKDGRVLLEKELKTRKKKVEKVLNEKKTRTELKIK